MTFIVASFGRAPLWVVETSGRAFALNLPSHLLGNRLEEAHVGLWHGQRERVGPGLGVAVPIIIVFVLESGGQSYSKFPNFSWKLQLFRKLIAIWRKK